MKQELITKNVSDYSIVISFENHYNAFQDHSILGPNHETPSQPVN